MSFIYMTLPHWHVCQLEGNQIPVDVTSKHCGRMHYPGNDAENGPAGPCTKPKDHLLVEGDPHDADFELRTYIKIKPLPLHQLAVKVERSDWKKWTEYLDAMIVYNDLLEEATGLIPHNSQLSYPTLDGAWKHDYYIWCDSTGIHHSVDHMSQRHLYHTLKMIGRIYVDENKRSTRYRDEEWFPKERLHSDQMIEDHPPFFALLLYMHLTYEANDNDIKEKGDKSFGKSPMTRFFEATVPSSPDYDTRIHEGEPPYPAELDPQSIVGRQKIVNWMLEANVYHSELSSEDLMLHEIDEAEFSASQGREWGVNHGEDINLDGTGLGPKSSSVPEDD